jgi:hypothetical protein
MRLEAQNPFRAAPDSRRKDATFPGCVVRSCGSVGIAAVFDAQDDDLVLLVVDPV